MNLADTWRQHQRALVAENRAQELHDELLRERPSSVLELLRNAVWRINAASQLAEATHRAQEAWEELKEVENASGPS